MQAFAAVALVAVLIIAILVTLRQVGGRVGGDVIVRCMEGHLFTTIWVPGLSVKAIQLGLVRLQRCPVADHVTFVIPVRVTKLTEAEIMFARQHRDGPIP